MRSLIRGLFVLQIIALMVVPVLAQEVTPEVTPEPAPVVIITEPGVEPPVVVESETNSVPGEAEVRDLATTVEDAFVNSVIGQSQIVALFVAILKLVPSFKNISARQLTFGSTVVLCLGVAASTYLGRGLEFESFLKLFEQLAPLVVQFVTTLIGAAGTFQIAKYFGAPLLGYSRTP